MAAESRGKRIAQVCVYGVLSICLVLMVASSPWGRRLTGSDQPQRERDELRGLSGSEDERPHSRNTPPWGGGGHDRRVSMPAYQDARDTLRRLDRARTRLLRAVAENDTDQFQTASAEYRASLESFREAINRLRDRVEPSAYHPLVGRLMMERPAHQSWSFEFPQAGDQVAFQDREPRR
jgi:hypothetical protein